MLTREMAEHIVRETMERLHRNINMMDTDGRIIASGDRSRLGERHAGAIEAIRSGKPLLINEANKDLWKGSQCGINIPVLFHQQIVGVIGITGQPEEVSELGALVTMTTELMLNQAFLLSEKEWRNRTKEIVIEALIQADFDSRKVDERLQLLRLQLEPPFYVMIIRTELTLSYNDPLAAAIEDRLGGTQALVGVFDTHRLFILLSKCEESRRIAKLERIAAELQQSGLPYQIGCSLQVTELASVHIAYQEAEAALRYGSPAAPWNSYAGLEPQTIVHASDDATKQRFVNRIFPDISEQSVRTLQVFFDCNLNIQEAAQALFVHRNTLIYRLKRIKELTGYDPQSFQDATALQMAIWIYDPMQIKE
ncbi:carbohydrate diacid regulator [Paenibacillus sp. 1_12]|uniref:CdaR family transcriptional regulator n=1 Tax=Paenibacillus sp. 1_12 TaxID=1566278 RepID=UPI0008F21332|nr:sugar diacid recognition domain-containing protein [Paenibacillus sp. 1_12]SFL94262.1 carbohydrate diacid regulator [Paenibacillus sp. 1_12]